MALKDHTRRKCFISYHHDDETEMQQFIEDFGHDREVLIACGIGASMSGDIILSTHSDYNMSKIREKYLRDTSITIVLVGRCTWARKFVDWRLPRRCATPAHTTGTASWQLPFHPSRTTPIGRPRPTCRTTAMVAMATGDTRAGGSTRPVPRVSLASLRRPTSTGRQGNIRSTTPALRAKNSICS